MQRPMMRLSPYFRLHNVEKGGCDLVDLIFFFRKGNLIPEGDFYYPP